MTYSIETQAEASTDKNNVASTASKVALSQKTIWVGAGWKLFSCACFAGINAVVRYLGGGASLSPEQVLSPNLIMFFQNLFAVFFLMPFLLNTTSKVNLTHHFNLHIVRTLAAALGVTLWYFTLKEMPISVGIALTFTGPVFTVIGAKILLGEKIGGQKFFGILLCMAGAFVISRPDSALTNSETAWGFAILLPLGSALALAWNKLLTRKLAAKGETPLSLTIHLLFMMVPVSLLFALPDWTWPTTQTLPWLLLLGLLGAMAHLSFGKAYAKAEVVFLTPFGFSKFLFSTALGYVCFFETPSASLWLGLIFIGMSIFMLTHKISLYSIAKRFKSS